MKRWADYMMPSYIEEVVGGMKDLDKFQSKATRNGLPQVLLFPSKDKTMPLVKFLSAEYRRKILLGEVKPTKKNKEIMDKFGVKELPALIVIPVSSTDEIPSDTKKEDEGDDLVVETSYGDVVKYDRKKEDFTRHKLNSFLSKYALKKIVIPTKKKSAKTDKEESKKATTTSKDEKTDSTKSSAKEEL